MIKDARPYIILKYTQKRGRHILRYNGVKSKFNLYPDLCAGLPRLNRWLAKYKGQCLAVRLIKCKQVKTYSRKSIPAHNYYWKNTYAWAYNTP